MSSDDTSDLERSSPLRSGVEGSRAAAGRRRAREQKLTPRPETTTGAPPETTRRQLDETSDPRFQDNNHHGDENKTGRRPSELAANGREKAHAELSFRAESPREDGPPGGGEPECLSPAGFHFTAFLYVRLLSPRSRRLGPEEIPQRCPRRFPEAARGTLEETRSSVNGRTSLPGNSGESTNGLLSLEKTSHPAKQEEEVVSLLFHVQSDPEIGHDPIHPGQTHNLSNGGLTLYPWNGTETIPTGWPQIKTALGSVVPEEDRKTDFSRIKNQNRLVDLSDPAAGMLSSTMVSVLAPHWSGRLRRNKKGVVTGEPGQDTQGNSQEVTHAPNSEANPVRQQFLERQRLYGGERWSRDRYQPQERSTVGWSTLSGPPSVNLNHPIKGPVVHSISLDVDSGRLDNRGIDGDVFNLATTFKPSISPVPLDLRASRRMSQAGHHGDQRSPPSSKPTTSSLLLSLRRLNTNWRNSNLSPVQSEINPFVTCSSNGRPAGLSRTHPTPKDNGQERSNETMQTVPSPFFPNHSSDCSSVSPSSKDSLEGSPFSNLPQTTMKTYPTFSYSSKQTLLNSAEKTNIDKTAEPVTDASLPSLQASHYDRFAFLKSQTLPRGTTLRSTSWWKHVTQDSSLPLSCNDTTTTTIHNKNQNDSSTVALTPSNKNLASESTNDNSSFSSQISSNRENNNAVESFHSKNLNISFMKRGTDNTLRQSNAQNSPDSRLQHDFNLNEREPQKPRSLPSVLFRTRISSVTGETTMSHTKDLSKPDDVSDRSYKRNETETPLTFIDTKSPNTPKASHSNLKTHHHVSQTDNCTPTSSNSFRSNYSFSFNSSAVRDPASQSRLKSLSSIGTSQNTFETSVLASEKNSPSSAFCTPSIPATTNAKSSETTSINSRPLQTEIKPNLTLTKHSFDTTRNGQPLSPKAVSSPCSNPRPKTPPFSGYQPLSPPNSPWSPKLTNTITTANNTQLLGFERTYPSIPQSFHRKNLSTLGTSPTSALPSSKSNYSPASVSSIPPTSSTTPYSTNASLPTSTTLSSCFLTPPVSPAITLATTNVTPSSHLTPPACSHSLARPPSPTNTPSPIERTFAGSLDLSQRKQHSRVVGSKATKLTWQELVDRLGSEATSKSQESGSSELSPQLPTSPLSSSRPRTPSIFSFLRLSSPTETVSSLSPPTPETSGVQVWKGGNNQPFSSPSNPADREPCGEGGRVRASGQESVSQFPFDHGESHSTTAETGRGLSEEESAARCSPSAPLSLPHDFAGGYKPRYSSPPYSVLRFTRSTRAEAVTAACTSPLSQQPSSPPKSLTASPLALRPARATNVTLPYSKPPHSPIIASPTRPLSVPFRNRAGSQESLKFVAMDTNCVNNNDGKQSSQDGWNAQTSLVDTRADIRSQPLLLQSDEALGSTSARVSVIETLVYRINKVDSSASLDRAKPKSFLQQTPKTRIALETEFRRQSHLGESNEVMGNQLCRSQQSSYGSSSKENQCPSLAKADDKCSDSTVAIKEAGVSRSRFFLSDSKSEMPPLPRPKRGLFMLKKRDNVSGIASDSSVPDQAMQPSPDTTKSETDRNQRGSKKMEQVLSKLRQTFSTKRLDDDHVFSWRCDPPSQTSSVDGSSDVSNNTVGRNQTLEEEREQEQIEVDRDNVVRKEEREIWRENRYTLTPSSALGTGCGGFSSLEKTTTENEPNKDSAFEHFQKDRCAFAKEQVSETESQSCLTGHSPTRHHIDFYGDKKIEHKPTNQSLPRYFNPARQDLWDPNRYATFPAHRKNSTATSRNPFSPFTFLSPFTPTDSTDDSVFYNPKLERRREPTSPRESGDWFNLVDSGRTKASTGLSCGDLCQKRDDPISYSGCADLKYGLEAGRSYSVSSVMSSRPSGPGRISTGSASDLTDHGLTFGEHSPGARGLDQWSVTRGRSLRNDCKSVDDYSITSDYRVATIPSDPGQMRSRSLPRSIARSLSTWGSEVTDPPPPTTTTTTKLGHLCSPASLDIAHFAWDSEGPPTPPPSPPWSPASMRMSKPLSLSSSSSPGSPGSPQDSQSTRGHLPSRGYVSSLTAFDESDSSDASSDTTTDDEYYLEMGGGEDKETEL